MRDEVSSSGYERVQHHVEVIPHAFDNTLATPSTLRHLECEELPRRSAGSRYTGCGVRDARRITHDRGRFSLTFPRPSSREVGGFALWLALGGTRRNPRAGLGDQSSRVQISAPRCEKALLTGPFCYPEVGWYLLATRSLRSACAGVETSTRGRPVRVHQSGKRPGLFSDGSDRDSAAADES